MRGTWMVLLEVRGNFGMVCSLHVFRGRVNAAAERRSARLRRRPTTTPLGAETLIGQIRPISNPVPPAMRRS